MSLTEEQKATIRSTAPILRDHGKEITSIFYKRMFEAHPELLNLFNHANQKTGAQPLALANTVYFAAENIDHLDVLMPQIQMIAQKHRSLMVLPEHYPIVGKYLLLGIDEFLGTVGNPSIIDAWSAAYEIIASIFIQLEKQLYEKLGPERNRGFLPMTIIKKEKLADGPIVAFTFKRSDGEQLEKYRAGQYLTVRIKKGEYFHNRHYSLTESFNGKTYRLAIKQEMSQEPKGVVSTEMINRYKVGDQVLATLPAGTFALIDDAAHHLFIAGGIGITVFSAMIEELAQQGKSHLATLIHCVPTESQAAFVRPMRSILSANRYHLLTQGKSLLQGLIGKVIKPDTHVYLCGSVPFMTKVEGYLKEYSHPSDLIHTEAFQPALSLIKNAVKDQSQTKSL